MPEPRKLLLSRTVHQVLSTAVDEPNARARKRNEEGPMPRRHVLSKCVNQILACGCSNERGMCWLPFRPLSGAARASVLVFLAREGLVRVTDWSTEGKSCRAGSVIGLVTNKGREVRARGYL